MSKVHYFQRYSQRENVATNNTLLLLSRLYAHDPSYLAALLNDLLEPTEPIKVGPTFTQQRSHEGASVPDALIEQRSFKLVVEAKRGTEATLAQLKEHLNAFKDEETKVLVLLTPTEQTDAFKEGLRKAVKEFNVQSAEKGKEVVDLCTTFEKIINSFGAILADHDHEMRELLEDYEEYCYEETLLPQRDSWLRAVPCGKTFEDNKELKLYYQPVTRSSREHKYLGIYKDKQVRFIGKVQHIVEADLVEGELSGKLDGLGSGERTRIEKAIMKAKNIEGYDISTGHKFFLVEEFHETSFEKVSPGGLQSQRYFDLVNELGLKNAKELPEVAEIAPLLSEKKWR
ncbi:hypothetical protein GBA65_02270 [Rubrobacter marinus]|uniref:PD-(D/E)XK nuclease superfamily protein n=1 Tax=Rubrobacter marinus TaxID=2653852 RepID=A0A6G8PTW3_9ACTN|nr:hypothetical protein [Rubrobacter marinus]QIN77522.1 hypothetical protein GBA65_02270 [Rubrobacter marinus]